MSRAELARVVGCSPSVITEILNGSANESPSIPAIHDALGWTPPGPLRLSEDIEELLAVWRQLDDAGRSRLLERAAFLLESGKRRP
jgi:transcriptional regulator with XRE-family HTH domain